MGSDGRHDAAGRLAVASGVGLSAPARFKLGLQRLLVVTIGRRGVSLLFFALLSTVYAIFLLLPPENGEFPPTMIFMRQFAPLWAWAILWGISALICWINAFRRNDRLGFAAASATYLLWALLQFGMQVTQVSSRAYVGAVIWLCLAGWVAIISTWPEPRYPRK